MDNNENKVSVREAVANAVDEKKAAVEEKIEATKEAVADTKAAVVDAVEEKKAAVEEKVEATKDAVEGKIDSARNFLAGGLTNLASKIAADDKK